jgi:hypothetical protein
MVPGMGDSITEGALVKCLKKKGDYVALDEVLLVIETDKVAVDVRAPTAGVVDTEEAAAAYWEAQRVRQLMEELFALLLACKPDDPLAFLGEESLKLQALRAAQKPVRGRRPPGGRGRWGWRGLPNPLPLAPFTPSPPSPRTPLPLHASPHANCAANTEHHVFGRRPDGHVLAV